MNLNNHRTRNRLMVSTALAGATLVGFGQGAEAACVLTAGTSYTCSGVNTAGQLVPDAHPTVTTDPGFSVNTGDDAALAIVGTGAVSYTDANASALTSTTGVGLGVVSMVPVGQLTPPYFSPGPNPGGAIAIDTNGALTGALFGLAAINTGDGATNIKATGDISATGTDGYGVFVYSQGSAATVTTGKVSGGFNGIFAINQGATADLSVTANGDVVGGVVGGAGNGYGIYAVNGGLQIDVANTIASGTLTYDNSSPSTNAGKDLTVTANGKVSGAFMGISASNFGTGNTSVTAKAAVTSTSGDGISAYNHTGAAGLTVSAAAVSGGYGGISAQNFGTGGTSVTATGAVTGTLGSGIYATTSYQATADLTIDVMAVTGSGGSGIYASNSSTGALIITAKGTVTGGGQYGIYAENQTIQSGNQTIDAMTVTGHESGIYAKNSGVGVIKITAKGTVTGTSDYGIYAYNNNPTTSDLTVDAMAVAGGTTGIYAKNSGTGATSVTAKGTVTGTSGYGIDASTGSATTGGLMVDAKAVTGGTTGISAINFGTGATNVTATGAVTGTSVDGIYAKNDSLAASDLTIKAATVTAGHIGIGAFNTGGGITSITATGAVTATGAGGFGIYGQNQAGSTNLTINATTVSGGYAGIYVESQGTGFTSITTTGAVTGTNHYGIFVKDERGTGITIQAAAATGAENGISTVNNGNGATSITTTGLVEGGTGAIKAQSSAGQAITITTSGLVRNTSQLSTALAVETSGGAATFTNSGGLLGTIKLGVFATNLVANKATWNTAGGTNEFGGGTLTNDAGKDIVTASVGSAVPVTTTFNALAAFTNNGRLTMANDVAGDVTRQIGGNATFAAGSVLAVDISGAGIADVFRTSGTATITGSNLVVTARDLATGHFVVLTAAGLLTGQFATVTGVTNTAFLSVTNGYDNYNAYLDVTKVRDFADAGLTLNQIATGEGLDSIPESGPLFTAVAGLATDAEAQYAFDQLSGEIHASTKGMFLEDSRFVRDATNARIRAAFGDGSVAALPVMAYGEGGPELVAADTDRFAVWGQAFGSWGNTDGDGNAAAFDRSTGGLLAGADTLVGGWRVGVLGGYSHSSFDVDDRNSSGKSDNYHLGLYGGTNWGALAFRTGAAYSWSSLSTRRSVIFNNFAEALSADYSAGTAQIFGELAYKADAGRFKADAGRFKVEPFANLAYVSVKTDGFTETGGAAALTSAGSTTDATFTTFGLRGSSDFALGGIDATARGTLGWRHAFGDTTPLSSLNFASGDAFTIAGVPIARDAAVIEAGLDFKMSANARLGLSYSGQFGGGGIDHSAKLDFGIKF